MRSGTFLFCFWAFVPVIPTTAWPTSAFLFCMPSSQRGFAEHQRFWGRVSLGREMLKWHCFSPSLHMLVLWLSHRGLRLGSGQTLTWVEWEGNVLRLRRRQEPCGHMGESAPKSLSNRDTEGNQEQVEPAWPWGTGSRRKNGCYLMFLQILFTSPLVNAG